MTRVPVLRVEYINNLNIQNIIAAYKDFGMAVECNDGKAKIIVWEGQK